MSDSTEDLKNIDSYGVWVKRPPQDAEGITEEMSEPAVNADEVSIDEPVIPEDLSFDTLNDNDSTLSDEEVSDITSGISEPEAESADDFFKDELPDFGDAENSAEEKHENEESEDSEISLDDFIGEEGFDDPNKAFEPKTDAAETPVAETPASEAADAPSFDDGELSLDDFMDGDFSDSGASFSGGSGSDEISLDDFFDDDSKNDKEDDVSNDEPLDIDLSFTENPDDKVPTEEEEASDDDSNGFAEDDMFDSISSSQEISSAPDETAGLSDNNMDSATEEISIDDFGIDENSDDATAVAAGASVNSQAEGEEVDLSDFGIDSDAGETPVKQDVHASKKKVVDYDIAITEDDSVTEAPRAEEVKTSGTQQESQAENENSVKVDSSMLDMIMKELSGLKSEINSLRDEFQNLKDSKPAVQELPEEKAVSESPEAEQNTEEPQAQEEEISEESEGHENSGFFDENDSDDTIALSGDELSNIMNTADITETEENASVQDDIEIPEELPEEFAVKPEDDELSEKTEENFDILSDETEEHDVPAEKIPEETDFLQDKTIDEPASESEPKEEAENSFEPAENPSEETEIQNEGADDFNEDSPFGTIDETNSMETEPDSGLSMNSDEEKLKEPDLDEINMKNMEEEISIPKVDELADDSDTPLDDILVESSNSDLINSVDEKETTLPEMPLDDAENAEPAEELSEEQEINACEETSDENLSPSDEETKIYEDFIAKDPEVSEGISDENIDYLNDDNSEADSDSAEETVPAEELSEPEPEVAAESEEPEISDEVIPEETVSADETSFETEEKQLPDDLKNDVKSVLLYMDQLLENLPEDKIMEFAKSEQFSTYKKLFSELGLSK